MFHHRMKLLALTAALACRDRTTGEGEPNPSDPPKLTEREFEDKRRTDLAQKSHDQLVARQIELERDVAKYRARSAPEGSRVLTADEATAYEAYVALGAPKDLKTKLDSGQVAETKLQARERGDTLREVAEVAGYKPGVLGRLSDGLEFEINSSEVDGKAVKTVSVKGADGKPILLSEYAKANWADFEPALATGTGSGTQQQTQQPAPFALPLGGAGTSAAGTTAAQALNEKRADPRMTI
jgi:hypothetical protein